MGTSCHGPDCDEQTDDPYCSDECREHAHSKMTDELDRRAQDDFEETLRG